MISRFKKLLSHFFQSKIGICFICDQTFSTSELVLVKELAFCKEDHQFFIEEKWICIKTVESDPDNPEQALFLTKTKDFLKTREIKSYITTSYKELNTHIITEFSLHIPDRFAHNYKIALEEFSAK